MTLIKSVAAGRERSALGSMTGEGEMVMKTGAGRTFCCTRPLSLCCRPSRVSHSLPSLRRIPRRRFMPGKDGAKDEEDLLGTQQTNGRDIYILVCARTMGKGVT